MHCNGAGIFFLRLLLPSKQLCQAASQLVVVGSSNSRSLASSVQSLCGRGLTSYHQDEEAGGRMGTLDACKAPEIYNSILLAQDFPVN